MYLIIVYTNKNKLINNIEFKEVYDKYTTTSLKLAKRKAKYFRQKYSSFRVVLKERTGKGKYIELSY